MRLGVKESAHLEKDEQAYRQWLERTPEQYRDSYRRNIEYESFYAWENRVTDKQWDYIYSIERVVDEKFTGNTKQEASYFISCHAWRVKTTMKERLLIATLPLMLMR